MNQIAPTLDNSPLRGMVAKTIIEVLRGFSIVNFGNPSVCGAIEENLIVAAIVVGQTEGRLLSASDISAYIGLPRPTVIRKLRTVAMARILGKVNEGSRACYFIKEPNTPRGLDDLRKVMVAIKQCCDRLSKMDDLKLDRADATG